MIIYIIGGIIIIGIMSAYGTIKMIESITIESEKKNEKKRSIDKHNGINKNNR